MFIIKMYGQIQIFSYFSSKTYHLDKIKSDEISLAISYIFYHFVFNCLHRTTNKLWYEPIGGVFFL
jgi:hypothetical protein